MINLTFRNMSANQLIQKLDEAISYLKTCSDCDKGIFIERLRKEICLLDSAGYLYTNYLKPLTSKSSDEMVEELERVKKNYAIKGHPFFNKWN